MRAVVLAIGLLLVNSLSASAEQKPGSNTPPRVSLELQQVPLREALKRLFHDAPNKHGVDSTVPDVPVSVSLNDVSRETALRSLLRSAAGQVPGIAFEQNGDYYQVVKRAVKPKAPTVVRDEPGADKTIYVRIGDVNLREAFRRLVAGTLVRIHVHETVPNVPVDVETRGLTLPEAARAITRDAALLVPGLVIRPQGGGYFVFIDDNKPGLAGVLGMTAIPGTNEYVAKIRLRYEEVTKDSWLVRYLQYSLLQRQLARQMNGGLPSDRGAGGTVTGTPNAPVTGTPNPPPTR